MKNTYIQLTDGQFIEQFKPEQNDEGEYYRQREWTVPEDWAAVVEANKERRVWTMMDCDGLMILGEGLHYVNRLYYVITEVPYPEDTQVEVYDPDLGQCWDCVHLWDRTESKTCWNCGSTKWDGPNNRYEPAEGEEPREDF